MEVGADRYSLLLFVFLAHNYHMLKQGAAGYQNQAAVAQEGAVSLLRRLLGWLLGWLLLRRLQLAATAACCPATAKCNPSAAPAPTTAPRCRCKRGWAARCWGGSSPRCTTHRGACLLGDLGRNARWHSGRGGRVKHDWSPCAFAPSASCCRGPCCLPACRRRASAGGRGRRPAPGAGQGCLRRSTGRSQSAGSSLQRRRGRLLSLCGFLRHLLLVSWLLSWLLYVSLWWRPLTQGLCLGLGNGSIEVLHLLPEALHHLLLLPAQACHLFLLATLQLSTLSVACTKAQATHQCSRKKALLPKWVGCSKHVSHAS